MRFRLVKLWLQSEGEEFYSAGLIAIAKFKTSPRLREPITADVAVAAEDGGSIVEIGNHHDVGLVISHTGFEPAFKLARVVRCSQVCVPNTAPDLQTTELVYQKDVEHTRHSVGTVNGRGAILQDVDVIDQRERNEVDVHATGQPSYGDALSIDEHQSFFGQQTTQVRGDTTVTAVGDVLVDGRTRLRRQLEKQIRRVADA